MGKKIFFLIVLLYCYANAYSRSDENETLKKKLSLNNEPDFDVRHLNKPFKINKLNLVWSKAKQVNCLMSIRLLFFFYLLPTKMFGYLYTYNRDVQNQN